MPSWSCPGLDAITMTTTGWIRASWCMRLEPMRGLYYVGTCTCRPIAVYIIHQKLPHVTMATHICQGVSSLTRNYMLRCVCSLIVAALITRRGYSACRLEPQLLKPGGCINDHTCIGRLGFSIRRFVQIVMRFQSMYSITQREPQLRFTRTRTVITQDTHLRKRTNYTSHRVL